MLRSVHDSWPWSECRGSLTVKLQRLLMSMG